MLRATSVRLSKWLNISTNIIIVACTCKSPPDRQTIQHNKTRSQAVASRDVHGLDSSMDWIGLGPMTVM